jgi:hypothetical protein
MKRYGVILGTALLSLAGTARADLIKSNPDGSSQVTVNYYWTATVGGVPGIYTSDSGNLANVTLSDLGSQQKPISVTFTNSSDPTMTHLSTLPSISNLVLNSGLLGKQTVTFNGGNLAGPGDSPKPFIETLHLSDPNNPSNSATVDFSGYLYGSVGTDGITGVQGAFLDAGPKTVTLGDASFSAQLLSISGPGDKAPGAIQAEMDWSPSGSPPPSQGGGGVSESPEPSTLVLSCLGLSFLGARAWRRRSR